MKTALILVLAVAFVAMAIPYSFGVEDPCGNFTGNISLTSPVEGCGYWTYRSPQGDLIIGGTYVSIGDDFIIFTYTYDGKEYIWSAGEDGSWNAPAGQWIVTGQHPFVSPAIGDWHLQATVFP